MTDREKLEAIKAEIERRIKMHKRNNHWNAEHEFIDVRNFIDSLPEEPVSDDADNAARDYADKCKYDNENCFMERQLCVENFKAGAKWQKTQSIVDACYHLEMRLPEFLEYNDTKVGRKDFIDDFRKALEED